jgi:hypothetical protein
VNPFTLDDADNNGITGSAVVNGIKLEEGKYPTIIVPANQDEIKEDQRRHSAGRFVPTGHSSRGAGDH